MMTTFRKLALLVLCGCLSSACGGPLYKVATPAKVAPPPMPAQAGELALTAQVLTSDQTLLQFDANLPLAGLVVVDVHLVNQTTAPLALETLQWNLTDSEATIFKLLPPKKALRQVMGFYGNRLFNPRAYEQTHADYTTLAFPLSGALEPQQLRRGFLFFASKYETTSATNLTLSLSGSGTPLQLKLN